MLIKLFNNIGYDGIELYILLYFSFCVFNFIYFVYFNENFFINFFKIEVL